MIHLLLKAHFFFGWGFPYNFPPQFLFLTGFCKIRTLCLDCYYAHFNWGYLYLLI